MPVADVYSVVSRIDEIRVNGVDKTRIPRILIAGTHSGCGKTTVSRGIMQALVNLGYTVQPFKVGPDFIDPTYHTALCGRPSRNLDPFMMGEDGVMRTFGQACSGADIAVIEGVMGMFDGLDGTDCASTAHVAKILRAPVLLVVDVKGMSRSAAAVVKGFSEYDPAAGISAIILNRVGSPRHREMIERSMTKQVLGYIPRDDRAALESRHLGLKMAFEIPDQTGAGDLVRESCNLDEIERLAASAVPLPVVPPDPVSCTGNARIGVARDEAFCFYYQDNLDLLISSGAEIVFFSPIRDRMPDVDALYLGGGYPELHAAGLSASPCRHDIRKGAEDGLPVYAECGGLLYLCDEVSGEETFKMAGVLPASAFMTEKIQALGYSDGTWTGGPSYLPAKGGLKGHEFHYSRLECRPDARFAVRLSRGRGIRDGNDGLFEHSTVGSYTHAYFSRQFARSFVDAALQYHKKLK
jgi:cobyrinic acid a,c-diamide synthase